MEIDADSFQGAFQNKRVLVTGDTGFKGSWLCEWLLMEGAKVYGIGLEPITRPSLFHQLDLINRIDHEFLDIRHLKEIEAHISLIKPKMIFHLAAQPLVRYSYENPVETFAINVLGTANLLESLKSLKNDCVVILITSDKCYENKEWAHSYRENDPLGGYDPYSASKGCCEIVINAFRNSYYKNPLQSGKALASVRAGNVIGGGDWSTDRIVPDCIKHILANKPIPIRNKSSTRPWQHVLEPLSGYLQLAAELWQCLETKNNSSGSSRIFDLTSPFNFGPELFSNRSVESLVKELLKHCSGKWMSKSDANSPHEASMLNLSIDKAYHTLGWRPKWNFERTVTETMSWYQSVSKNANNTTQFTQNQIRQYKSE
jgi:CDP-glucose 4,6-dehydratase